MNKWMIIGTLCLIGMIACSGMKGMQKKSQLTITPPKLELFVNQQTDPYTIQVSYTLNIPADYIHSCARLIYKPHFVAAGHSYELTPLVITGTEYARREKRLKTMEQVSPGYADAMHLTTKGEGMKVRLSQIVPFELWMAQAKLMATVNVETCNHRSRLSELTLADGVIYMPLAPGPAIVKYVRKEVWKPMVKKIWFTYAPGQSVFQRNWEDNSSEMQEMMKWIDSLQNNSDLRLQRIVITGSSSPTGNFAFNQELAEKRAQLMKQRLVERRHIEAGRIEVRSLPEDWAGLYEYIEKSDIPDKFVILRIWESAKSNAQREALLKKSPQYKEIERSIFPKLRRVTCEFYYTQKVEEIIPVPL